MKVKVVRKNNVKEEDKEETESTTSSLGKRTQESQDQDTYEKRQKTVMGFQANTTMFEMPARPTTMNNMNTSSKFKREENKNWRCPSSANETGLSLNSRINEDNPIFLDNIDDFIVGYDDYKTSEACENKLFHKSQWWKGARFSPSETLRKDMKVDEELMWRIINSKRNVLISGKAGAGKSYLLERFVTTCEASLISYALCAPTGIAAYNVGGETIHRRLGLGLANDDPVSLFKLISGNRRKYARTWKFLTGTDILIIDEISMVHSDFFKKLDYLFRKAKNSAEPFGGIILIMVGDFTQLGPITERSVTGDTALSNERFVVDSECWQRMPISRIFLNRSYRQKEGDPFLDLLNEVRTGHLSEAGKALLYSRIDADIKITKAIVSNVESNDSDQDEQETEDDDQGSPVPPTYDDMKDLPSYSESEDSEDTVKKEVVDTEDTGKKMKKEKKVKKVYTMQPLDIFPYKYMVDKCNTAQLEDLVKRDNVELHKFFPALRVAKREHATSIDQTEYERGQYLISKEGIKQLQDYFPLFYLTLAEGAQVMMRSNKYIDVGVFNGTMGIITSIEPNFISVLFVVDGKFMDRPIEVSRAEMAARVGKTVEVIMTQYPLTLAYASTIHKCQGLTLDSVRVDASNCFEPGQFYVAISRVRKIEDLSLIDFNEKSIMADKRAVDFETHLSNESTVPHSQK
jgi:ATP-dependent DNA helicase PIF1